MKKENIILKKYIPLLKKYYKIHELTKENIKCDQDYECHRGCKRPYGRQISF